MEKIGKLFSALVSAAFFIGMASVNAWPEEEAESVRNLAKAAQNPIAHMISLPFQSNFNFGVGPKEDLQYIMNIQPVIPLHLNNDWNLITRIITPIIHQPALTPMGKDENGLGDINPSFFFSPANPEKLIWGIGPTMTFPTATKKFLGYQKYSAGPTAVALTMKGPWVYGALINNQWSFAGNHKRKKVNAMLLQPFVNYNLPKGWYLTSSPIMTANWVANTDNTWTVPVGGGIGKILRIGKLPVNATISAYYNAVRPTHAADWQLRFQIQLLFPEGKKKGA